MPKASQAVKELEVFIDNLKKLGDKEIPNLAISCYVYSKSQKEQFINICSAIPRPATKSYTDTDFYLRYNSEATYIMATSARDVVCTLISEAIPAKYDCEPLLSPEEESLIETE